MSYGILGAAAVGVGIWAGLKLIRRASPVDPGAPVDVVRQDPNITTSTPEQQAKYLGYPGHVAVPEGSAAQKEYINRGYRFVTIFSLSGDPTTWAVLKI